jgi:hypothetical protein
MAWTTPTNVATGDVLTATRYNNEVVGNTIAGHPIYATLPATPTDGDSIYYQTSAMASLGALWNLRYRAAGGTYKWEFVGGSPIYASVAASVTATTATPTAKTGGPSFTVPLAGIYLLTHGATMSASLANSYAGVQPYYNASAISADSEVANGYTGFISCVSAYTATLATSGNTLELYYRVDSGTGTFIRRFLRAVPIAVA